ncbi:hypothetical protein ALC60_00646, partial [Trachymyrmex zeteki]
KVISNIKNDMLEKVFTSFHRRVIEVLQTLQGTAVGAALCKALEAIRSSPSSIRTPYVWIRATSRIIGVDCQPVQITRENCFDEIVFKKSDLRSGEGRLSLSSVKKRKQRQEKL